MSLLPIRVRVTAAFALAMAGVLAGSGLYLYLQLGSHLALPSTVTCGCAPKISQR